MRTRNHWLAAAFIFCLPMLCVSDTLASDSISTGAPLADRIPGDALIYWGWPGSQSMGPAYSASHLKAVLDASAIPQMFEEFLPQVERKMEAQDHNAALLLHLVSTIGGPMWRHPSAFYFGGIDWSGPSPIPRIAMLCDAGEEADKLLDAVTQAIQHVPQEPVALIVKKYGSLVVLSVGPAETMDKLFGNAPADALMQAAAFKNALQQVQPGGVGVTYVDVQGIVKLIDDAMPRTGEQQAMTMWPKIRDALGLTGFRQAIVTNGFDGQDWSGQAFIGTDGGKAGLLRLFNSPPLDDSTLAVVPKSADRVFVGHFDLAAMFREIRSGIEQFDPNAAGQFDDAIAQANAMLGLDIQKDLLDSLGDQWALYTDRTIGGPGLLGFAAVNRLKNPDRADAALTGLADRANQILASIVGDKEIHVQFRHSESSGVKLTYLPAPFSRPAGP